MAPAVPHDLVYAGRGLLPTVWNFREKFFGPTLAVAYRRFSPLRNDKQALLAYTDRDTYRDAGQGGFEIRTFISVAAAARGRGELQHYAPIPIFAVGCTIAVMDIAA